MHQTLYNFIFEIDKKLVNFCFFWNTLSPTLTTNTGLAINTLTTNTGLAVNTLTTNKACLVNNKLKRPPVGPSNMGILIENITLKFSTTKN